MPELTPEAQACIAGAIVWLLLWGLRRSPWAGDLDKNVGFITAIVVAGVAAFALEYQTPPFEVLVFLRGWFVAFAVSQAAYNSQKRILP